MSLESCKTRSSQQRCILLTQPTLIRILQRPTKRTVINTRFDENYAKSSLWFWILTKPTHNIEVNTILYFWSFLELRFALQPGLLAKACIHKFWAGGHFPSVDFGLLGQVLWILGPVRPSTYQLNNLVECYEFEYKNCQVLPVGLPGRVLPVLVAVLPSTTIFTNC